MTTLKLKDIEIRVSQNTKKYSRSIDKVTSEIKAKNLNRGRVRPRDPSESIILDRFTRK